MKPWSSRFDTKARVCPSGDQVGDSLVPLAKNACSAGFDPSRGAIQILLSTVNATRRPPGATAGSSPSPISLGGPPEAATAQTCIFGWRGLLDGSGTRLPSAGQFAPWSPPRT